jgi:outer membrane receptor protein involved in Fe transport
MLAVAWAAAPRLTVRAAAGRAVRAPTYVERYINTAREDPQGNVGTPDLQAERAWNAEGGLDWTVPGLALRATAFWRRTDSLIDYVRDGPDGGAVFRARNVFEAEAAGVEVTAQAGWRFSPEQALRLSAAYAYTDVQIDAGAFAAGDFKYVLDHSPHLVQGRAAAEAGRALLSVEALHKTRVGLDAVTVAHARLALALRPHADGPPAQVYVEARNAFDARYTEVFGAPMPGRLWLAGLRLRLGR